MKFIINYFKRFPRELPIQGSRFSHDYIRFVRLMMYIGAPGLISILAINLYFEKQAEPSFAVSDWGYIFLFLLFICVIYFGYLVDKGYRNRANISDEEYESLGYKPMSGGYLAFSVVLALLVNFLNKYYLHWW